MASTSMPARSVWAIEAAQLAELARVALGTAKADLVILDGTVVNVYTGELQEHCSIAVKGGRIAYVGTDYQNSLGPETKLLDATGKFVIPGLIDGHTHYGSCSVDELLRCSIPTGTTTIVTELAEIASAAGVEGTRWALDSFDGQPIRMFGTLSPLVGNPVLGDPPIAPVVEYAKLLDHPRTVGIGESFWADVALKQDEWLLGLFATAQDKGKSIEGHTAGARGNRLQAYLATGISSCHEPTNVDEAVALLRLGLHVLIRYGMVRKDLAGVAAIRDRGLDLRRLAVCSDSPDYQELLAGKYMNGIVEKAIALGFEPIAAIQMASLNVAEHLHLDYWIGGLGPGKCADLSIIPDLRHISPEYVVCAGRIIARDGRVLVPPKPVNNPASLLNSVHLRPDFCAADFRVVSQDGVVTQAVRGIEQVTDLVTQQARFELPVRGGELLAQPEQGIIKVAAIERRNGEGERFVGFVSGHGLRRGAFATTLAWDNADLVIVGADDADMALAANHLVGCQGGAVVCADGKVVADFPAHIAGLFSDAPLSEQMVALTRMQEALISLGSIRSNHLITLNTMTTGAIPHFRIHHTGYYSVREGRRYGLFYL